MAISMMSYSRSHHRCKIQKLNSIYFKSCGLAARGHDTLHALGIAMSQKWSHSGIETLSCAARSSRATDISVYPFIGAYDNINLPFKVYEQRLSNQKHFDSGTVGTIIVLKDPTCVRPNFYTTQAKLAEGMKNPITFLDILDLDISTHPRLESQFRYQLLKILIDSPDFDFNNYEYSDDNLFSRPKSTCQLPTGKDHATCQYMLDTVHIEEATYEGNERVLEEWFRQLDLDALNELQPEALLVWIGDQLTVSRIRGLQRFHCRDLNSRDRYDFLRA